MEFGQKVLKGLLPRWKRDSKQYGDVDTGEKKEKRFHVFIPSKL